MAPCGLRHSTCDALVDLGDGHCTGIASSDGGLVAQLLPAIAGVSYSTSQLTACPHDELVVQRVVSSVTLEDVISGARSVALGMALGQPQAYGDAAQQHALCMYLVARDVMRARVGSTAVARMP